MRRALLTSAYIAMPFVLGLILWVATDDESVAFLSGLLFAVLSMGIESRVAESGHRDDVFKAIGLSKKIARKREIEDLVSSYESLLDRGTDFERDLATALVSGCVAGVRNLRSGGCTIPVDEVHARSIQLVKAAKTEVFATSVVENAAFWTTGPGKEYSEACKRAVRRRMRGIKMTRIFMPRNAQQLDQEAKGLIRDQKDAGVDVGLVFTEDLQQRNLHWLIVDFAIFDDRCALALQFPSGALSPVLCGNYCTGEHQQFSNLVQIKRRLLSERRPVEQYIA